MSKTTAFFHDERCLWHSTGVHALVLPIGGKAFPHGLGDKRPEVIAALAAAEILIHVGRREVTVSTRPVTTQPGAIIAD